MPSTELICEAVHPAQILAPLAQLLLLLALLLENLTLKSAKIVGQKSFALLLWMLLWMILSIFRVGLC